MKIQKIAIYTAITSESTLPSKYSEYTDVFSENKINSIPPVTRTDHVINFEKNSIISYKSIYHFSEKELIVLRQYLTEN
jgi:hypothetical protein